ncbi:desaturase [Sinorhizobium meliloti]|nr:sterol desaturase family protein [Sinorhizobium meliloti]ASQ12126.1 desaturase [Sinorhizobium meliloti]MQU84595.1 sterol desaturase family protein [Sinorhizobium meliloti]MQU90692.1 sterol desaturase family protein [Sinorhizobium meliloti]
MSDAVQPEKPNTGGWAPPKPVETPPVFVWPPKPMELFIWLFGKEGYLLPLNIPIMLISTFIWWYFIPDLERMKTFEFGWIAQVYAVNLVSLVVWTTIWHARFYVQRAQDTEYKYNRRWPKDTETFMFGSQLLDNMFWTLVSGVTIWTAYLVVTLWAMANGWLPYLDMAEHPFYFALFMFLIALFREFHFYSVHRLLHFGPLYKWVHSIHHKNSNPIPWSGMAMHPVEHLFYMSGVLIHWIIPSNPLLVVYHLQHLAFMPAPDHSGFAKLVVNGKAQMDVATYMHYLHHRYFEVNYGGDGFVPLDRLFGTWHNGSAEAHERMNRRFKEKKLQR